MSITVISDLNLTGKICTKCKKLQSFENYSKYKNGLKPACKKCYSIDEKARRILKGGTNHLDKSNDNEIEKQCTKCLLVKNRNEFKHPNWCLSCIKIANRNYASKKGIKEKFIPFFTDTTKQCAKCKEVKLLTDYSNSKKGRFSKSAYCKKCASLIQLSRKSPSERKLSTQKYRNNNREWWRFLHRLNQFNRRLKVKKYSDNTITKQFMIDLYNTEICYYCKQYVEKENRTCEHKQPLNKEGVHGISNLVMSCSNCNSSKRDMTEIEFLTYKQNKNE